MSKPKDGAVLSAPDAHNPDDWVTRTVPIIPRSEQYVALRDPQTGMPIIDPKTGKIKAKLVTFDDDDLDEIIEKANHKMAKKNFSLVHIEHTIPGTPDDEIDPEVGGTKKGKLVVGFLRNHRKGIIYDENGKVIDENPHWLADMVIHKKHAKEAFNHPHRSPEIDAHSMTLDSLALTHEPPKYEMGLVMNYRDIEVTNQDHDPSVDLPKPTEDEGENDMAGEAGMVEDAPLTMKAFTETMTPLIELAHILREHLSGEHEEPDGDEETPEGEGDEELQNEAETVAGPTNVAPPKTVRRVEEEPEHEEEDMRNCDGDMTMQNSRDVLEVAKQVGILTKKLAAVEKENRQLKTKLDRHENELGEVQIQNARKMVDETMDEILNDYEIQNPKSIETRLINAAALGDEQFETEKGFVLEIIQNSRKPLRVAAIPSRRGGNAPAQTGALTEAQTAKIRALSLQKGMSYTDAKAEVLSAV